MPIIGATQTTATFGPDSVFGTHIFGVTTSGLGRLARQQEEGTLRTNPWTWEAVATTTWTWT